MTQPSNLVVYLARAGVGSRRACDELIKQGAVTINDEVVTFPREKVEPDDVVAVNGDPVTVRELRYLLVNKPRGVASTRRDPHAERVIVDLVPNGRILFPVGRLDVDTTGLIILTNDGVLANRLMHPRYGVPKTYVARVRGKVSRRALGTLRQGVDLEDGPTAPAEVNLRKQSAKTALVDITIHEGRKRQVRRMFEAVGLPVEELHRRRYGPLGDKGLEPGGFRELSVDEVEALRRAGEEVVTSVGGEIEGDPLMLAAEVAAPAERPEDGLAPGPLEHETVTAIGPAVAEGAASAAETAETGDRGELGEAGGSTPAHGGASADEDVPADAGEPAGPAHV